MTPEEERLERLATRVAALNKVDAALHAVMQVPTDDEPEDSK